MIVEGKELVLGEDTGASKTVMPKKMFKEKLGHLHLPKTGVLSTVLTLCGETEVHVSRDSARIFQSGSWDPHVRPNWGPKHFLRVPKSW